MTDKTRCSLVRFAVAASAAVCVAAGLWLLLSGTGSAPVRAAVARADSTDTSPTSTPAPRWLASAEQSAAIASFSLDVPQKQPVTKSIEQVHIFDRVLGTNPQLTDADRNIPEPDPATWRVLSLLMAKTSGKVLDIKLARSLAWIEQVGAKVGGRLAMDLPEMGAVGEAEVLAIDLCPRLMSGPGNVVTGTFAHEADANLLTLRLSGGVELIGVTDNHPFWSEDRSDFVEAGTLQPGEHVSTRNGLATIVSVAKRPLNAGERVYNLEVHGEHVYQVTTAGVLVHNSYVTKDDFFRIKNPSQKAPKRLGSQINPSEAQFLRNVFSQRGKPNLQVFRTNQAKQLGDFLLVDRSNPAKVIGYLVDVKAGGGAFPGNQLQNGSAIMNLFGLSGLKVGFGDPATLLGMLKSGNGWF